MNIFFNIKGQKKKRKEVVGRSSTESNPISSVVVPTAIVPTSIVSTTATSDTSSTSSSSAVVPSRSSSTSSSSPALFTSNDVSRSLSNGLGHVNDEEGVNEGCAESTNDLVASLQVRIRFYYNV